MTRRAQSALVTSGWLLVACWSSSMVAGVAHADDDDTAYVAAVGSVGIASDSVAMAPGYGRGLCGRLAAVGFDPLVAMVHTDNAATGITMHQAALIVGAATSNYCMTEIPLLPKTLAY